MKRSTGAQIVECQTGGQRCKMRQLLDLTLAVARDCRLAHAIYAAYIARFYSWMIDSKRGFRMHITTPLRHVLVLIFFLSLLIGCSSTDAKPTPAPTPTPTPSLASVATGAGVSRAAEYRYDESGPHPITVLSDSGEPHEWNERLPAEWSASSTSETELVALVFPEREDYIDRHEYKGGPPISRYRYVRDVTVRSARTGSTLWAGILKGGDPKPFPEVARKEQTRMYGSHTDYKEFKDWLSCKVEPQQCTHRTLQGRAGWVWSVAFSPDGQTLAVGSRDGIVRLRRVADGALLYKLNGHTKVVFDVDFGPDGQILASSSRDESVCLWRVSDGKLLRTLKGHTDYVRSVAISPDGQIVASGADDHTIRLWQATDGALLQTFEDQPGRVRDVAFSPDGQTLAAAIGEDSIRLWRVSDGSLLRKLAVRYLVLDIAYSPDGQILAAGLGNQAVRLWQLAEDTSQSIDLQEGPWSANVAHGLAFSPDGDTLATGLNSSPVLLWRVSDGALIQTFEGHQDDVESVAHSPDGQMLASGSRDETVRLWRLE